MSDESTPNEGEGIKNLRKEFEALQKTLKERDELLASYQAKERKASVAEVLKAKGLNESLADGYAGDDYSEDAVSQWIEAKRKEAELFLGKPADTTQTQSDPNALAAARISALGQDNSMVNVARVGDKVIADPAELAKLVQGPGRLPYSKLVELGIMPDPATDPYHRPPTD